MPGLNRSGHAMNYTEQARVFHCGDCRLLGITTLPEQPADTAVLIVVGGPQYRSGSHRQFTLLARQLAEQGYASLRFDYRGMGDSEGEIRNFEAVNDDLSAATDCLLAQHTHLRRAVIWGLCDAASAALFYAHTDPRISGLILLNPWVHTEASAARTRLKHYYLKRLMQPSFWAKLLSGKVEVRKSAGEISASAQSLTALSQDDEPSDVRHGSLGYANRMRDGLQAFRGATLILLSGDDLVAQEFSTLIQQDQHWGKLCRSPRVQLATIKQANHTFASHVWREQVADRTTQWLINTEELT